MASIKIKQVFETLSASGYRGYGSSKPVEVTLSGDGKVYYTRWDDTDTTSAAVSIFESTGSPLPSGAKLFHIRATKQGVIGWSTDSTTQSVNTLELVPDVWTTIGAQHLTGSSTDTVDQRLEGNLATVGYIAWKCVDGNVADVEVLAVY